MTATQPDPEHFLPLTPAVFHVLLDAPPSREHLDCCALVPLCLTENREPASAQPFARKELWLNASNRKRFMFVIQISLLIIIYQALNVKAPAASHPGVTMAHNIFHVK